MLICAFFESEAVSEADWAKHCDAPTESKKKTANAENVFVNFFITPF